MARAVGPGDVAGVKGGHAVHVWKAGRARAHLLGGAHHGHRRRLVGRLLLQVAQRIGTKSTMELKTPGAGTPETRVRELKTPRAQDDAKIQRSRCSFDSKCEPPFHGEPLITEQLEDLEGLSFTGSARRAPAGEMTTCCFAFRWTSRRELRQVTNKHSSAAADPLHGKAHGPIDKVRALPGNTQCADCGRPSPDWAAVNHGVVICIRCAGVHRKMGSHVSTVLSLTLDTWDAKQMSAMHAKRGNTAVNQELEARLPPGFSKDVLRGDNVGALENFVRSKYEFGAFRADGDGKLVAQSGAPTSTSKVAMVEYVGVLFIVVKEARNLPAAYYDGKFHVAFATDGQRRNTKGARTGARGVYSWEGERIDLNAKSTSSVVTVQLFQRDMLMREVVRAIGSVQVTQAMESTQRQTISLVDTATVATTSPPEHTGELVVDMTFTLLV